MRALKALSRKSIKANYILNLIYQGITILFPLILTPYLSRKIGSKGIGEYSYYLSYVSYFALFSVLGIPEYGNRAIAQAGDKIDARTKAFYEIYCIQLVLSCLVSIIYIIFINLFFDNKELPNVFIIYLCAFCFDITWFFNGIESFKTVVTRNVIIKVITLVMVIICVNTYADTPKYAIIYSVSVAVSNTIMLSQLRNNIGSIGIFLKNKETIEIKKHLKPILILFVAILAVSIYKLMDKIMLGLISGTEEVGYYECGERLIRIPLIFVTALATVMLPRISNMLNNGEEEKTQNYLEKSIYASIMVSSALCFGIIGVADIFVPIFYGGGFERCIGVIEILLPSCVFLAFANVIRTQYILPHSMDKEIAVSLIIGAIVNAFLNMMLIPMIGAYGASVGTLVTELVVCIMQCLFVRRNIPVVRFFIICIPFCLLGFIMAFIIRNINIQGSMALCLVIRITAGGIIYVLGVLFYMTICKRNGTALI